MAHPVAGVVKPKRSLWRLSTITHFFWSIVNFISIFFVTMFSKDRTDEYKKGSSSGKKWGGGPGGGGPGRGPYGGVAAAALVVHVEWRISELMNKVKAQTYLQYGLPACGSCCGG
ncbi:unnamed protein product [Spirodela intermedia]|uniref:Uncharacterized protein n=1 Tax=Spirodela intermedia TaxID=51605 RepID=A0A7I8IPM0_SPIIN|nr:unnamed protein product [Spirodela intermedia]CAA6659423.1 unnamed protein product [Spirodela intermedia]